MSSQSTFKFDSNDLSIEITGERSFVEAAYRRVMRDIDAARDDESEPPEKLASREHVVWIIRSTPMMRRIYMAESIDLKGSPLSKLFDTERLRTAYLDRDAFDTLLPSLSERDDTLWAELTEAGRRKIAGDD